MQFHKARINQNEAFDRFPAAFLVGIVFYGLDIAVKKIPTGLGSLTFGFQMEIQNLEAKIVQRMETISKKSWSVLTKSDKSFGKIIKIQSNHIDHHKSLKMISKVIK